MIEIKSDKNINYNFVNHTVIEHIIDYKIYNTNMNGLLKKYSCGNYDDCDFPWYPINASGGRHNCQEFSVDNQEVLKKYMLKATNEKNKLIIVEIGVNRNKYEVSSTSIFLKYKRNDDIYIGIDIEDKTQLNNTDKNIYTIMCASQNTNVIFDRFHQLGIKHIDILMIDGYHSINQVYFEWENYTKFLSDKGIVIMHDTNAHPGPYFLLKSIDTSQYDVYKYFSDIVDWGIGVAIKK